MTSVYFYIFSTVYIIVEFSVVNDYMCIAAAPPTPSPSPLHKAIHICTTTTPGMYSHTLFVCMIIPAPPPFLAPEDPSVPVLALIRLLYVLNQHWTDLYQVSCLKGGAHCMHQSQGIAASPIVPPIEFINQKLSAKAMRQLQGVYCIT